MALTLNTVGLDAPPVLGAGLLVVDQVVTDGDAPMGVWLHEGHRGNPLGHGREPHRVRV